MLKPRIFLMSWDVYWAFCTKMNKKWRSEIGGCTYNSGSGGGGRGFGRGEFCLSWFILIIVWAHFAFLFVLRCSGGLVLLRFNKVLLLQLGLVCQSSCWGICVLGIRKRSTSRSDTTLSLILQRMKGLLSLRASLTRVVTTDRTRLQTVFGFVMCKRRFVPTPIWRLAQCLQRQLLFLLVISSLWWWWHIFI